jgi:transposase InsO family protein
VAVARLARLALGSCPRETGNSRRLASQRFPTLLDLEKPARASRETFDSQGRPRADPQHEQANPLWGAPRVHGEILKLGIELSQATVAKYMVRYPKPPSQTWRKFLENHSKELVSIDFFTVPTITFHVLYVFLVLAHDRRRVIHFNVTAHPTAEWVSQQLVQAFPWDTAPRYLVRDRDAIYGERVRQQLKDMAVKEILTAPRCPWQSRYVERLIGSIRRECLDHIIVINQDSLRRTLRSYFAYYHRSRIHLALHKDAPDPRPVHPPEFGSVFSLSEVGGLHHRYERRAA